MNRQGAIVQEPTFFSLRITSALTIVYTFQIFLLTATLILFPSIYLSFIYLFTAVSLYSITAFFTSLFFIAVIRRNRSFLRISLISQITAFLYTFFSIILIVLFYCGIIFPLHTNFNFFSWDIVSIIVCCFLLFLIHLETPLIVYLTKSGSEYFKSLHEAEYIEEESIATIKIEEQSRPKEVPELSVTDLCRQASSETESCASTEESDIDSINLPAPINKFHSISLDSYHDCKDN